MARTGLTGRVAALDVERVFLDFVRNANQVGKMARTVRADPLSLDPDRTARHVPIMSESAADSSSPLLLTTKKPLGGQAESSAAESQPSARAAAPALLAGPGERTQKVEAALVVPDVGSIRPPEPPVPERVEDGQMPAGELDRQLTDMAVLLRYGHHDDVGRRLDELLRQYPEDLLLLKRVAQFHLETENPHLAKECLFQLASVLFERRNVLGMRQALEQVLVMDPSNKRANKLLGLLEARPDAD
ncbi:MAG: hypothetical protein GXP55_03815 [Deltaproteobacteria bacterium]|nr:hypothetical protein [Deltaproteobacteria bacterium]